jgi:hypothetical protein
MMFERDERERRMRNYRTMFRGALVCLALGVVMTVAGGVSAVVASADVVWAVYGLLLVIGGVGSAYLTVDSTVRIIEAETDVVKPRSDRRTR